MVSATAGLIRVASYESLMGPNILQNTADYDSRSLNFRAAEVS